MIDLVFIQLKMIFLCCGTNSVSPACICTLILGLLFITELLCFPLGLAQKEIYASPPNDGKFGIFLRYACVLFDSFDKTKYIRKTEQNSLFSTVACKKACSVLYVDLCMRVRREKWSLFFLSLSSDFSVREKNMRFKLSVWSITVRRRTSSLRYLCFCPLIRRYSQPSALPSSLC